MDKETSKMKNQEKLVKLSEARKQLSEWDWVPLSSIRKALNQNPSPIPHMKTSHGKRASCFLKVSDLKRYFESLKQ